MTVDHCDFSVAPAAAAVRECDCILLATAVRALSHYNCNAQQPTCARCSQCATSTRCRLHPQQSLQKYSQAQYASDDLVSNATVSISNTYHVASQPFHAQDAHFVQLVKYSLDQVSLPLLPKRTSLQQFDGIPQSLFLAMTCDCPSVPS
eukprot:14815-Heterococcus_DN1.PRE.1